MNKEILILMLNNRIALLESRKAFNSAIISKLKRRIRAIEEK